MSNIRLIISDIDGTILTSNHQVDEQLIEVMPELEKANIPFVLASARSPLGMQPIAHKLGLHDNPIACYNGALVLEGDRTIIRFEQTNLGHLIAEAQRQKVKADVGIMNSGGVRDSLPSGDITYKDVLKVHPFGNQVSSVELNGQELLDYLNVVALKEVDSGAYAQYSGISMVVDRKAGKVEDVKIQGKPLDLKKKSKCSHWILKNFCGHAM